MKTFKLEKFETFQITGRGTVFTVHRDENDVEGITTQDMVVIPSGKRYLVTGIEMFRNMVGIGKNIGLLVKEIEPVEIKLGNSCGSCIHSNRPKTPRAHAAHYEVAKTERWCFLHNCHITRETTCDDHEGVNRSAKTSFTKLIKYNERQKEVLEVVALMGDKPVFGRDSIFFVKNNWLYRVYGTEPEKLVESKYNYHYSVRSKDSSTDRYLREIREILRKSV